MRVEFFGRGIDCGTLPSLESENPDHTVYTARFGLGGGDVNNPNLEGFQTGNNFAAVLRGITPVRLEGSYTFILTLGMSDTASLTIDGVELIATGCSRPAEYSATVHLGSGAHLLHLVFADDGWSDHLVRLHLRRHLSFHFRLYLPLHLASTLSSSHLTSPLLSSSTHLPCVCV